MAVLSMHRKLNPSSKGLLSISEIDHPALPPTVGALRTVGIHKYRVASPLQQPRRRCWPLKPGGPPAGVAVLGVHCLLPLAWRRRLQIPRGPGRPWGCPVHRAHLTLQDKARSAEQPARRPGLPPGLRPSQAGRNLALTRPRWSAECLAHRRMSVRSDRPHPHELRKGPRGRPVPAARRLHARPRGLVGFSQLLRGAERIPVSETGGTCGDTRPRAAAACLALGCLGFQRLLCSGSQGPTSRSRRAVLPLEAPGRVLPPLPAPGGHTQSLA